MKNQQSYQQQIDNRPTAEIPPAQRVYAFLDLPKEIQGNLLRLQNSDGDFLRVRNAFAYRRRDSLIALSIGLVLFLTSFAMFLSSLEHVVFDLKWIFLFSGGALIFALCFLYLFRGIFRTRRSPIKIGMYLTPTQVIETADGLVRYRELKDMGEISVNKFQGGWRTSLDVKFADGDLYKYELIYNDYYAPPAKQLAEAKKWQEKVGLWRDEAVSAAQRGDTAYFNSLDVIQKSVAAHLPVLKKNFPSLLPTRLMFIISIAMVLFTIITFWVIELT